MPVRMTLVTRIRSIGHPAGRPARRWSRSRLRSSGRGTSRGTIEPMADGAADMSGSEPSRCWSSSRCRLVNMVRRSPTERVKIAQTTSGVPKARNTAPMRTVVARSPIRTPPSLPCASKALRRPSISLRRPAWRCREGGSIAETHSRG
ncbi:hypothetical protein [Ornithinimicrobium kibberense]|uniref:hypothetical protein n=1 Tax=Ornithinimicrobium kibberense TaxID=282060 RepID=UPI0036182149